MATVFGVTAQGFRRKTFDDIVASMQANAKLIFGQDIDLSDGSPVGDWIKLNAFEFAEMWQTAEDTYHASFVPTADGASLDAAVKYAALRRRPATKATGIARFTGVEGSVIFKGTFLSTATVPEIAFRTTEEAVIGANGTADVPIEAVVAGSSGNVAANTITVIMNPSPGVQSVTNPDPMTPGLDLETDLELRDRFLNFPAHGGSTADAILANLLDPEVTPGVLDAKVFQNTTMETNANGMPPKSVWAVVFGGEDDDIATSIHKAVAAGIAMHGEVSVALIDDSGQERTIKFSRAAEKPIYVVYTITKDATYPANGDTLIRDEAIRYIGGLDSQSVYHKGLGMGEKVIRKQLESKAFGVPGVIDVDVTLGFDPDPIGATNLVLAPTEIAVTDAAKVVIQYA